MEEKIEPESEITLPEDKVEGESDAFEIGQPSNMFNDIVNSLKNLWLNIMDKHYRGVLPLQLLGFVVIYNFVFFQAEEGKEIYVFIPLLSAMVCYMFKYWEFPSKIKYYFSGGAVIIGLLWDLIVSISFIPTYTNWGYDFDSIPTLLADFFGILSAIVWFTNEKKILTNNLETSQDLVKADISS